MTLASTAQQLPLSSVSHRPASPLTFPAESFDVRSLPRIADPIGVFALRRQAQETDARLGVGTDLGRVWRKIRHGELLLVDTFCSELRHFVVLTDAAERRPACSMDCDLLERVLLSDSQKRVAIDSGVAESTLSMQAQRALQAIGARFAPSKAPLVLAFLVSAAERDSIHQARESRLANGAQQCRVISLARPELRLASALTAAEYHVLCRLVEGLSYAQIAAERGTTTRTVANQVASLFRRLHVSGRGQLISLLVSALASD